MFKKKIPSEFDSGYSIKTLSFTLFASVFFCNLSPVFATSASSQMFSALNTVFAWVRNLFLVGAAISIASFAFSFFFAGGSDGEKRISAAQKKMLTVFFACAALSFLPSVMNMGASMVRDGAWKSGSGVASDDIESTLSGNHIITPADTSEQSYADVEDAPVDPENPDDT